jgi:ABC-2 type transport system ATP-binding protein
MTDPAAIRFDRVTRRYGAVLGLNDVSLEVGRGITGLVGPNGAGKTTLLNLAVGLHRPSSGTVSFLGADPFRTPSIRSSLGYCPDGERAWEWMSGRRFVVALAELAGLPVGEAGRRADSVLAELELTGAAERPIATYSRGMRQKVRLAQAVLHDPSVLVLDEPLNGVDPLSRHQILRMLERRVEDGASVLISSHVLHELDGFVDQVVLLQRGRLLASGSITSIRELLDEHPHTVRIVSEGARELARALLRLPGTVSVSLAADESWLELRCRDPLELYMELPGIVLQGEFEVREVVATDTDLESVFRYLVKGGAG